MQVKRRDVGVSMEIVCAECGARLEARQVGLCPVCGGETKVVREDATGQRHPILLAASAIVVLGTSLAGLYWAWWIGALVGFVASAGVVAAAWGIAAKVRTISRGP